jgi:hypothetical protein
MKIEIETQIRDYVRSVHRGERPLTLAEITARRLEAEPVRPLAPISSPAGARVRAPAVAIVAAALVLLGGATWLVAVSRDDGLPAAGTSATTIEPGDGAMAGERGSSIVDQCASSEVITCEATLSYTVPAAGWSLYDDFLLSKSTHGPQGAEAIVFWTPIPEGTNARACGFWQPVRHGTAEAIAGAPGVDVVSGPSEVVVGGHAAHHVTVRVREDAGCDPGYFYSWKAQTSGASWEKSMIGDTIEVWIVEIGRTGLFIAAETRSDAPASVTEEIRELVASMSFE